MPLPFQPPQMDYIQSEDQERTYADQGPQIKARKDLHQWLLPHTVVFESVCIPNALQHLQYCRKCDSLHRATGSATCMWSIVRGQRWQFVHLLNRQLQDKWKVTVQAILGHPLSGWK